MQISISNVIGQSSRVYSGGDYIINNYVSRVIADGGTIEGLNCVRNAFRGYSLSSQYSTRVISDGGSIESINCATSSLQELSI